MGLSSEQVLIEPLNGTETAKASPSVRLGIRFVCCLFLNYHFSFRRKSRCVNLRPTFTLCLGHTGKACRLPYVEMITSGK